MKKVLIVFLTHLIFTNLYAPAILNISIPKAGTYLLKKTTELITGRAGYIFPITEATKYYQLPLFELKQGLEDDLIRISHLIFKPEYEALLQNNNIKVLFIIRDPRDQLVAQTFAKLKSPQHGRFAFDSLLSALIGDNAESPVFGAYHFQDIPLPSLSSQKYISHVKRFYEAFLPWQASSVCYTTRFESLVGSQGGGTNLAQQQEVSNMAKHLEISLTQDQIKAISSKIFGGTTTFREGKIGSWKKYFKEEHKRAFKAVAGDLLIALGYEQDLHW